MIGECYRKLGPAKTRQLADDIKRLGFNYATKSGITMAVADVTIPQAKREHPGRRAEAKSTSSSEQFRRGLITDDERYQQAIELWTEATRQGRPRR